MSGIIAFKNSVKIIALAILIIVAVLSYSCSSKTSKSPTPAKGPQALSLESEGIAEFNAENDTINDVSIQDKKMAEEMMPIIKKMGDGKDTAKNKETVIALGKIITKYIEYSDAYFMRATISILAGDKDYHKILSDVNNAIKFYSSNKFKSVYESTAEIYGLKSKVDMLSNNYLQAINDLETAIKIDPSNTNKVFNTGGVKPEDESNPTALQKKELDLLVSRYPNDYRSYMFRGLFYSAFTRFDEQYFALANKDLNEALKINPQSALVNYFLGENASKAAIWSKAAWSDVSNLTGAHGGYREQMNGIALDYYKETVRLDPNFKNAYSEIAGSLYSLKRYSEAIPYYDKVIELQPQKAGAYNDRGLSKTNVKDYYSAISDFSKAIELKKAKPNISLGLDNTYENRAAAYMKVSNYDSAIEDYSRAIGLKFASQAILMSVPQIRVLYPEFAGILDQELVEGIRQKYFPNISSLDFAATMQHDIINKNEAKKPYKEFVLGDLYTSRGDAYLLNGNFRRASKDYSRAIYQGSVSVKDRWKVISKTSNSEYSADIQTLDFSQGNIDSLWVKILNTNTQNYTQQNYKIDCSGRKIKSASATNYNSDGNVIFSSPEQKWQSIVPESIGEVLYSGICK